VTESGTVSPIAPAVVAEKLPGSQVGLSIEIPQAAVDAAYERVLSRLVQRARIEGFRPGKAPRALVESRLGPAAVREEVIEALVPQVVSQVIEERSIEAIDTPQVDVLEFERGRPARLSARVSVYPDVKLPDLDALQVSVPATEVTEDLVARRIDELRDRLAQIEPVEREIAAGDVVVNDLDVEVEGRVLESESRRAMEVEVKEGVLIPELLAALPGKRSGDIVVVNTTLPEDHSNPDLAGKEATLRMTVQGVKEKRVPELSDELAEQLSGGEQKTLDGLREAVRKDLEATAVRMRELALEQAVVKAAVDGSEVEVPAALVEKEVEHQLEHLEERVKRQGIRLEQYLAYLGLSREQWLEQARPDAADRIKVDLVLEEIMRQEKIEPSDEEVLEYMAQEAETDPEVKGQLEQLKGSRSARSYFKHRLQRLRTLQMLVARAAAKTESTDNKDLEKS
jgi:trigger factor